MRFEDYIRLLDFLEQAKADGCNGCKYINKDEYEELLKRARQELRAFKEKYKMLTELDEILNLID